LDRNVNVFFGANGSGKTSLLKILHSAISGNAEILARVPFTSARVDIYSVNYNKVFRRTIKADKISTSQLIVGSDVNVDWKQVTLEPTWLNVAAPPPSGGKIKYFLNEPSWSIDPKPEPKFTGGFADRYLPTSRVFQGSVTAPHIQFSGSTLSEAQLDAYFAESIKNLWTSYSADIASAVNRAQQKGLANILKAVLSSSRVKDENAPEATVAYDRVSVFLRRQPGFSTVLGSRQDFSRRYQADPQLKSIVRDIDVVEKEIERASAPREMLKNLIQKMFSSKDVKFTEKDIEVETESHIKIELSALSSGEKQLLRIFIETLMAQANTILIDEPEISMHIDWQRSLVQSMTRLNPQAQIILATHSPEVMADVKEEHIFRL
jgi:predicted ATP-dependent endonuclease of OLD family